MSLVIASVVGTRPNFVKLHGVHRAIEASPHRHVIIHTGQHFDGNMSDVFFEDLAIPSPEIHLAVEAGPPALQTAAIMERLHAALPGINPDWILSYGDVTSTPAAALTARLSGIRSAHVEAGFRSFDRKMPEEVNRVVTDHVSDLLLAPDRTAAENLAAERIDPARIRVVGSTNIDALRLILEKRSTHPLPGNFSEGGFAVFTLHRPANVDDPEQLRSIIEVLGRISARLPVLFPVHPRTRARLEANRLALPAGVQAVAPLSYAAFLSTASRARVIMTDSGGLQEEAAFMGVPCIVLRGTSERPALVAAGYTRLVGSDPKLILAAWERIEAGDRPSAPWRDEFTDGRTGSRIVAALEEFSDVAC